MLWGTLAAAALRPRAPSSAGDRVEHAAEPGPAEHGAVEGVPGIGRDHGAHGLEGPPLVVVHAGHDVGGDGHVAGVATRLASAGVDRLHGPGGVLGRHAVHQHPVGAFAGQPEHPGAEGRDVHGDVVAEGGHRAPVAGDPHRLTLVAEPLLPEQELGDGDVVPHVGDRALDLDAVKVAHGVGVARAQDHDCAALRELVEAKEAGAQDDRRAHPDGNDPGADEDSLRGRRHGRHLGDDILGARPFGDPDAMEAALLGAARQGDEAVDGEGVAQADPEGGSHQGLTPGEARSPCRCARPSRAARMPSPRRRGAPGRRTRCARREGEARP